MPKSIQLLQLLIYVVPALLAAYGLAWLVLLITCIRKKRFYPILGGDRPTRWFWLATFLFCNPLLTLLYVCFGLARRPDAPRVRTGPTTVGLAVAVIAISGFFIRFPGVTHLWMAPLLGRADAADAGRDGIRSRLQGHAAAIEARNSTNSTTASSSGDHTRFACRRIALAAEGNHALIRLVAAALREELAGLPGVEEATLHAHEGFPDGGRRPDVFIRLSCGDVRETDLPYNLSLEAAARIQAGRSPWSSTNFYRDGAEPPLLDFTWQATVDHRSRTVGQESVKYGMAAANIAKELGEQVGKAFRTWREKYSPPPELPEPMYGTAHPAELPAALAGLGCERPVSYTGLLLHNETFWRFRSAQDANSLLRGIAEGMKADGWREYGGDRAELRLSKAARHMQIFRPAEPVRTGWVVERSGPAAPKPPATWYLHDERRFAPEDRRAALEGLLTEQTPLDTLLFISRLLEPLQRERYYQLLEMSSTGSLPARVELVHHYLSGKDYDKAERAMAAAGALLWSEQDEGSYSGKLDDAARQLAKARGLSATQPAKRPAPKEADFLAAGFLRLDPNGAPVEREVGLGEPASVFAFRADKGASVITVRVAKADRPQPADPYVLKHLYCEGRLDTWGSMRAWGATGGRVGPGGIWRIECPQYHGDGPHVLVNVESIPGKERFRVMFRPAK